MGELLAVHNDSARRTGQADLFRLRTPPLVLSPFPALLIRLSMRFDRGLRLWCGCVGVGCGCVGICGRVQALRSNGDQRVVDEAWYGVDQAWYRVDEAWYLVDEAWYGG